MGTVLGKISVETPKYDVAATGEDFEIREYPSQLAAEVTYDPASMKQGRDGGFMILASYIGAVGKPANIKAAGEASEKIAMTAPVLTQGSQKGDSEKIAMTAPVITQEVPKGESEKIAMTAPVITHGSNESSGSEEPKKKLVTMQFLLPAEYTSVETAPKPTDSRVSVKEIPSRKFGVLTFSGVADDTLTEKKLTALRSSLEKAGYKIIGDHLLARYNPPWTPGFLRTNEVLLPVE